MTDERRRRFDRGRAARGASLIFITAAAGVIGDRIAESLPKSVPDGAWWAALAIVLAVEIVLTARYAQEPVMPSLDSRPAVDALASAVEAQWRKEAATRAIEYPASIRVRWKEAERLGVASAEAILGEPIGAEPHVFRIRGDVSTVAEAYLELPRDQLCVLGRPGGGKTVLVVLLTLRLLERRLPGAPAPVLLTLSSWDPRRDDLLSWLARRIGDEYRFLTRADDYGLDAPQSLVAQRLVVPILDGLDEIAQELRPDAIAAIEHVMAQGFPVVLTCRGDEFEAAVSTGVAFLSATPTIELQDVHPDDAREFLVEGTVEGHARWEPVLRELKTDPDSPAAKALRTPLMLWLAREVYRNTALNPAALLDRDAFANTQAIEWHLLDRFVTTAYAHDPPLQLPQRRFRRRIKEGHKAEVYLRALAINLYRNRRRAFETAPPAAIDRSGRWIRIATLRRRTTWTVPQATDFDFRWWDLYRAVPNASAGAVALWFGVPLAVGPAIAVLATTDTLTAARLFGLLGGGFFGILVATLYRPRKPGRIYLGRLSRQDLQARLRESLQLASLAFTALFLTLGVVLAASEPSFGVLWTAFAAGVIGGVGIGLTGLLNGAVETVEAQEPEGLLTADRTVAAATAVLGGLTAFAVIMLFFSGFWPAVAAGLAAGVASAIGMSSWGWFFLARLYFGSILWSGRRLPWALMTFLEDAHLRGVLRQSGSVYQFRHRRLQERLASRDAVIEMLDPV
jgi:hypothetical protein